MAAAGGAGPAAAGMRGASNLKRIYMSMMETGNYGEPGLEGMGKPWWREQFEPDQRMPSSEHLTSSGYSSNRARFPTGKARKEHYTRKAILEAKKEEKRRAHYAKYRHLLGSPEIAKREAERKTRKQRERNIRRALKARTRKSRQ